MPLSGALRSSADMLSLYRGPPFAVAQMWAATPMLVIFDIERISTGDTTAVGLLAVIVFISGAAGILIIKRKGVKQHEK